MRFSRFTPHILSRYLWRESTLFFSVSLLAFIGILLTIRMLKLSSLIINKGVEAKQIALVFLTIIPTFLEVAVPLATLLGVMLAFARLSGDSEIVVMRASGISFYQLLRPVASFGALIAVLGLGVSLYLKPWSFRQLSDTLFEIARTKTTATLEEGVFNKFGSGQILYAEAINDVTGDLGRVVFDDKRNPTGPQVVFAQSGRIVPDPKNRTILFYLFDGTIHQITEGKYLFTDFRSNVISVSSDELYNPETAQKGRSAREMTVPEMREAHEQFTALRSRLSNGEVVDQSELSPLLEQQLVHQEIDLDTVDKKLVRIEIEQVLRYAMPFASLLLALVAMPLGVQPPRMQRTWGAGLSVCVGVIIFVMYYAGLSIGITLAESRVLPSWLALWIPNIATAAVAAYTIRQISTERWQSIGEGAELISRGIRSWLPRRAG
jgi:lipopolysaccharide export system permease protein